MPIRKALLPNEYQEVEYIESTGTQWIDTGFKANLQTKVIISYALTVYPSTVSEMFVGARDSSNVKSFMIGGSNNGYYYAQMDDVSSTVITNITNDLEKHLFVLDKNGLYIDGILSRTFEGATSFQTTGNCMIFRVVSSYTAKGKLYSCSFYDNGTLIRNFVPCVRKSDSVAGLFDTVNKVFYTNQGTGTFVVGANIKPRKVVGLSKGASKIVKAYKGENIVFKNLLPAGFIECEYLESTGTQFVDTGCYYLENSKVEATLAKTNGTQGQYASFFGTVANGVSNPAFALFVSTTSPDTRGRAGAYIQGETTTLIVDVEQVIDQKFKVEMATNSLSINNGTPVSANLSYSSCPRTIKLFARGGFQTDVFNNVAFASMRLYDFKLYDGSTLVRNFIPCLDSTGTPCLYDTVSKTAFYNQGTGDFLYKVKVPRAYQEVEYIQNDGNSYINTLVSPKNSLSLDIDFAITDTSVDRNYIVGFYKNTGGAYDRIQFSYATQLFVGWGNTNTITVQKPNTNKHNILMSQANFLLDGTSIGSNLTAISTDYADPYYLVMFALQGDGEISRIANGLKIYKAIIKDNSTLARYFVPVYKKSTGEIGLYDLVNDKFYTNAGTGEFVAGRPIIPSEYQAVEYIESSGTQWIDTGVLTNDTTWVSAKLYQISTGNKNWFGGTALRNNSMSFCFNEYSSNESEFIYGNSGWIFHLNWGISINTVFEIDFAKNQKVYVNGNEVQDLSSYSKTADTLSLCIFIRNGGTANIVGRVYYFKIFDNSKPVRHFVPCYRKSDNIIGLYDTITGQLFTNQGTGTFIKGGNI